MLQDMRKSTRECLVKPQSGESTCYCGRLKNGHKCLMCQYLENGQDCFSTNNLADKKISIAVTGTNGKSTVTNTLGFVLSSVLGKVGYSSTTGLYINGDQISDVEHVASQHYIFLLNNPDCEVVVCEQPITGIWAFGLPVAHSWGIITNITRDHTEMPYIKNGMDDIYKLKASVATAAKSGVITSVDYPLTRKLVEEFKDKKFFLFGLDKKWVKYYTERNYQVFTIDEGEIFVLHNKERQKIGEVKDFAICKGGILSYNVENILPMISVFYNEPKFKTVFSDLISKLKVFETDFSRNPARFNIFRFDKSYVVFDYAHNVEGYKQSLASLKNLAKKLEIKRISALVGIAENRSESDVKEVADLINKSVDDCRVRFIKDNENLNLLCKLLKDSKNCLWKDGYEKFILDFQKSDSLIYITIAGRGHISDLESVVEKLKLQPVEFSELLAKPQ